MTLRFPIGASYDGTVNLRDLRYLVALADERHFGKAAERCYVSQPTLSAQVRKLEDYLGVPLVERQPKRVALTPTGEKVVQRARVLLQEADAIYTQHLRDSGLYKEVWQAGAMLLPVQSVGVMGDERTYENVVCLRAVESLDGMTADWCHLPYDVLAKISNEIINNVKGINRVVYDISSKPPATIEWE